MNIEFAYREPHPVTLGELCEALSDETLPSARNDGFHVVTHSNLRRYLRARAIFDLEFDVANVEQFALAI